MAAVAQVAQPSTTQGASAQSMVPFRQATRERVDTLPPENQTIVAGTLPIERTIEGSGFAYGIVLEAIATAASNAATVAFAEDGPWSALDQVIFKDVNGELVNLSGYDLYIANLINHEYSNRFPDQSALYSAVTGSGGTGGSFSFQVRVPIGTNRRDLLGILGNQDRAQKYSLRTNIAGSSLIYSTPPTTLPPIVLNKYYENYSVPLPRSLTGAQQAVVPDTYGTLHFTTSFVSETAPAGGAGNLNHFLRRIGNTVRWVALIFRSNGSRATAQTNAPTSIQFKTADDTQFTETYNYRRARMFERFGFDFPNGVLVYDALHDFWPGAGSEIGDDYWHTQTLNNAQFLISYPSGFGSTNNSLKFITDDLLYQPPVIGPASVVAGR